jgi:hypothetical protein
VREPILQRTTPRGICDELDAEADLGEGDRADLERFERQCLDKRDDPASRLRTAQLR